MFRKYFSLLLAAILVAANAAPVAQAAGNDPLVLHTEAVHQYATHYYLDNGTPARTEWTGFDIRHYTNYIYADGTLVHEEEFFDDKLCSSADYDQYGTQIDYTQFDHAGEIRYQLLSEPTYDAFGRLTNLQQWSTDTKSTTNIRYEYYDEPAVFLGHYEQDGDLSNGPEPIEWLVLGSEGENLLLISKYGLDSRPYHNKSKSVNWETCDIRDWLNGEFLADALPELQSAYFNAFTSYFTLLQTPTNLPDRFFLLSTEEVKQYFPEEEDRICIPTPYAVQQNAYTKHGTGAGWWFLRTSGKTSREVVNINTDGSINSDGARVSGKRGLIRPAMWVSKTIFSDAEETPSRKHETVTGIDSATGETRHLTADLYTYDEAGRLICKQDYLTGDMEEWSYDDRGNLTTHTYMGSNGSYLAETTYTNRYSDNGLLLEQDALTVITEIINGKTKKTTETSLEAYVYDAAGRLTFTLGSGSASESYAESRTYDAQGNLLTVVVNGEVTEQYTYVPLSQALVN